MTPIITPAISTVLLRTQSDERLVALVAAGHERAFEALCDRHRPALTRALRRILPPARVEDALQQTFLGAWTALSAGTEVRALAPWLHRIARNAAVTALARPGYDHAELHEALRVSPGPEEDLERRDVVRRTLQGVAALPDRQRDALLSVAVQGRAHAQVAAELGLSEPAVRQLVHRARTSLRTAVGALVPTPLVSWALTAGHAAVGDGVAGAAVGAGGTGVLATVLKVGAIVAAVSTPVVGHAITSAHPPAAAHAAVPAGRAGALAAVAARHAAPRSLAAARSLAATAAGQASGTAAATRGAPAADSGAATRASVVPVTRRSSRSGAHLPALPVTLTVPAAVSTSVPAAAVLTPPAALPARPAASPGTQQQLTARWLLLLQARRTQLAAGSAPGPMPAGDGFRRRITVPAPTAPAATTPTTTHTAAAADPAPTSTTAGGTMTASDTGTAGTGTSTDAAPAATAP